MAKNEKEKEDEKKSKWALYLSLSLVGILVLLYFVNPSVHDFVTESWEVLISGNEQKISQWVGQFSWWGPMVIILATIIQMFLLVIPTPLLMVVTVLAYGPYGGTVINLVAIFLASSIAYKVGAYFGASVVERLMGAKSRKKVQAFIE